MNVTYGIGKTKKIIKNAVLAIGVFDGIHLGHKELIKKTIKKAKQLKGKSVVMTFDPHPINVLHKRKHIPLIISPKYRLKLLEDLGIDECFVINFTKRFSQIDPETFIKKYLIDYINPKEVYVGDDFRFGKDRKGTLEIFRCESKKYGLKVDVLHNVKIKDLIHTSHHQDKISSTTIRQLIKYGELDKASCLLGRQVSIMGEVVKGDGRGKSLGFPTANINLDNEVIPPLGIYAVKIKIRLGTVPKRGPKRGQSPVIYKGMANLGIAPTFEKKKVNLEVNIFNFNKNIYGKTIIVELIKKIRDEKKFRTQEALIAQMEKDRDIIRKVLS